MAAAVLTKKLKIVVSVSYLHFTEEDYFLNNSITLCNHGLKSQIIPAGESRGEFTI